MGVTFSKWWKRSTKQCRFVIVLARLKWIEFLVWAVSLLPLSRRSVQRYTAWVDQQLMDAFAFIKEPLQTFEEGRKGFDAAFNDRGSPLRWIHPMPASDGIITIRTKVMVGSNVVGYQGADRLFIYLEPSSDD